MFRVGTEVLKSCNWSDYHVATGVFAELQLMWLRSCNWSACHFCNCSACWVAIRLIKIIKITCPELHLKCWRSCYWSVCGVATGVFVELQLKWFQWVAIEVLVVLKLGWLLSCDSSDKIIRTICPELQLKCSRSCNQSIRGVASAVLAELQLKHGFVEW
jgi:hypothetical protein